MFWLNRQAAAAELAVALEKYQRENPLILALPRGGVVLGGVLASYLAARLQILLVKKISHPFSPEYAIGALVFKEEALLNQFEARVLPPQLLQSAVDSSVRELDRRYRRYQPYVFSGNLSGQLVIIVDDGVATGLTMEAAIIALRARQAAKIIVAVPVLPLAVAERFRSLADELVALQTPLDFLGAVGAYYRYFPQVKDEEVIRILKETENKKNILKKK